MAGLYRARADLFLVIIPWTLQSDRCLLGAHSALGVATGPGGRGAREDARGVCAAAPRPRRDWRAGGFGVRGLLGLALRGHQRPGRVCLPGPDGRSLEEGFQRRPPDGHVRPHRRLC